MNIEAQAIKEDPILRDYEVKEDGTVIMQEKESRTATFSGRDFLSFYREYEKSLEAVNKQLSDEHRQKLEEQKAELEANMAKMKPFVDKADELYTKAQQRKEQEQRCEMLKQKLAADAPPIFLPKVYDELDDEFKQKLTHAELKTINALRVQLKRKTEERKRARK